MPQQVRENKSNAAAFDYKKLRFLTKECIFSDTPSDITFGDSVTAYFRTRLCAQISVCSSKRYLLPLSLAPLINRQLSVSSHESYLFFSQPLSIFKIVTVPSFFVNKKMMPKMRFKYKTFRFSPKTHPPSLPPHEYSSASCDGNPCSAFP